MVDELFAQFSGSKPLDKEELRKSRLAHFQLAPTRTYKFDKNDLNGGFQQLWMDEIMSQVPGMDNYPGRIEDKAFGETISQPLNATVPLNVARYSRLYSMNNNDAMGVSRRRVSSVVVVVFVGAVVLVLTATQRGFNDNMLYVAQNTRPEVSPLTASENGATFVTRNSYAIPLEIVYTTPLQNWNPHNLPFVDRVEFAQMGGGAKLNRGRSGRPTNSSTAYNITSPLLYFYWTPEEFFLNSTSVSEDAADTSAQVVGVIDRDNTTIRRVVASGIPIVTSPIGGGVGSVRIRYPGNFESFACDGTVFFFLFFQ